MSTEFTRDGFESHVNAIRFSYAWKTLVAMTIEHDQTQRERIAELERELRWIDEVLSRRPALDGTRAERIEKTITVASRADELECSYRSVVESMKARQAEAITLLAERDGAVSIATQAERERDEAQAEGTRWVEAILKHYPVGWAFDSSAPELMVNNCMEQHAIETEEKLKIATERLANIEARQRAGMPPIAPEVQRQMEYLVGGLYDGGVLTPTVPVEAGP